MTHPVNPYTRAGVGNSQGLGDLTEGIALYKQLNKTTVIFTESLDHWREQLLRFKKFGGIRSAR
jgi:hypothetical protein